jgi:hypothetical protein
MTQKVARGTASLPSSQTSHGATMSDDDTPKPPHTPWHKGMPTPNQGTPNRFSQRLVEDCSRHWKDHGYSAIERVFEENPGLYLKTMVSLVPRELLLSVSRPMEQLPDADLQAAALQEQEASQKLIEHIRLRGGAQLIEQAQREVLGGESDEDDD